MSSLKRNIILRKLTKTKRLATVSGLTQPPLPRQGATNAVPLAARLSWVVPDFSVPTLSREFWKPVTKVAAVYSQPPRGRRVAGTRSGARRFTPLPKVHGLSCSHTDNPEISWMNNKPSPSSSADAAVIAAYGLILPKCHSSDAPRLGCFNVHASLLPRWRGAAPIQRAILAGDREERGHHHAKVDEGLDTGPMLLGGPHRPSPETRRPRSLHDTLAAHGWRDLMVEALEGVAERDPHARYRPTRHRRHLCPQKLERDEGRLGLELARPDQLERAVRALNPWPGVWFEHGGERIKVLVAKTETVDGPRREPLLMTG